MQMKGTASSIETLKAKRYPPEYPQEEVLILQSHSYTGIKKELQRAISEGWRRVSPVQGRPGSAPFEIVVKRRAEDET